MFIKVDGNGNILNHKAEADQALGITTEIPEPPLNACGFPSLVDISGDYIYKWVDNALVALSEQEIKAHPNYIANGTITVTSTGTDVDPPDNVDEIVAGGYVTVTITKKRDAETLATATDTVYLSISTPGFAIKSTGDVLIPSIALSSGTAQFRLYAPTDLRVECELRCYIGAALKGAKSFISISA